ncbi:MAG: TatD family hydrolase [Candidatus Diapherotrites archaeon]
MPWIDFHTHILDSPSPQEAARHSVKANVSWWCQNTISPSNWNAFSGGFSSHPTLIGLGWHPEEVIKSPALIEKTLAWYKGHVEDAPYLGETGLDFLYGDTTEKQSLQMHVFRQFIEWAVEYDKLIVVHSRHAKQQCLDRLSEGGAQKVILHWFSGNPTQQRLIIEKKWVCTVGPAILNSSHMDTFIQNQPLELIGLETDSPIPFGGKPSDPSWIPLVARRVAEIKGVSLEEVERAQEHLFARFFPTLTINSSRV